MFCEFPFSPLRSRETSHKKSSAIQADSTNHIEIRRRILSKGRNRKFNWALVDLCSIGTVGKPVFLFIVDIIAISYLLNLYIFLYYRICFQTSRWGAFPNHMLEIYATSRGRDHAIKGTLRAVPL